MRRALGWGMLAAAMALAACAAPERLGFPPLAQRAAPTGFSPAIRLVGADPRIMVDAPEALRRMRGAAAAGDGVLDILALSGGGAGGAFAAGALAGLTQAGARPDFELVTGVSTGALIAPFAFLGPDWDPQLVHGYRGDGAERLLQPRGLGMLFRPSLYRGEPLRELIDPYISDALIAAVAREAAQGRYLLVATTDLDTQQAVIWDLTRLATEGGAGARVLFRDILVASASIPGIFPPIMLDLELDGRAYQEMHVDGGVAAPFFVAPELWTIGSPSADVNGARIWIVVNDQLAAKPAETDPGLIEVTRRALEAVTRATIRGQLERNVARADHNGAEYHYTFIPTRFAYEGSLDFETERRNALFNFARACAERGELWLPGASVAEEIQRSEAQAAGEDGAPPACPAATRD